ncbi:hypothetical protein GCM10011519_18400 [Marmoricola endophyticus]|uniref:Uncharacterized protein n=1 Tax=Marmoricola endophyticus TaxID=2040280 RepID=A0A917BGY0_9ACTN|nr:hypothetical protein [Marmoricola endophyticus]GGF44885.1 hypothetical protein GCM10011519_18400 [Marmoricola endophyticus]
MVNRIDAFVVEHMSYLWDGGFQLVRSEVTDHNGGDGALVVEGGDLRIRIVQDRSQLLLDLQRRADGGDEWFPIDLVRRLYTGERERSAVLDDGYAALLGEVLPDLQRRFAADRWPQTRERLKILKRLRSTEMFG